MDYNFYHAHVYSCNHHSFIFVRLNSHEHVVERINEGKRRANGHDNLVDNSRYVNVVADYHDADCGCNVNRWLEKAVYLTLTLSNSPLTKGSGKLLTSSAPGGTGPKSGIVVSSLSSANCR